MSTYVKVPVNLREYIEEKIHMLKCDFYMKLTDEEERHFYGIKTEAAVDAYAHRLIMEKL